MAEPVTYLVTDKREGSVIPHLEPLLGGRLIDSQIHTGDYLLCRQTPGIPGTRILACFERKSIKDFVASLKDGRYDNREKMFKLRDAHGCQLYWIVEGPAFPSPTWKCGRGVEYATILKAMTTLPLASGVHILQTKDEQHTAERLRDFVAAAAGILEPYMYPVISDNPPTARTGSAEPVEAGQALLVPEVVTGVYQKDPDSLCMELWNRLPGISITTAKLFVCEFSVEEFLNGNAPDVSSLKTASGRALVKKGRTSMTNLLKGHDDLGIKVLSGISGISVSLATQIFDAVPGRGFRNNKLRQLCSWSPEAIAMIQIKQKSRTIRLGEKRARQILKMLRWGGTTGERSEVDHQAAGTSQPRSTSAETDQATEPNTTSTLSELLAQTLSASSRYPTTPATPPPEVAPLETTPPQAVEPAPGVMQFPGPSPPSPEQRNCTPQDDALREAMSQLLGSMGL